MGGEGGLHPLLYCTCISLNLSSFLFFSWVRLFFLDSMAVYLFVVCVWWGSSLSFSLDRRGDGGSGARQQSGGRGTGAGLQLQRY
jgi:hypothetical protein